MDVNERYQMEQGNAQTELATLAKEFEGNNLRLSELSKLEREPTSEEFAEKLGLADRNHQISIRRGQIMAQNGAVKIGDGVANEN